MLFTGFHAVVLAILHTLLAHAAAQSTTVYSVTLTTTVHATSTDYSGACDNFVGACVVYGTGEGAAYTTTVYGGPAPPPSPASPPPTSATPTSLVTSTTTIIATTSVSNSGACSGFDGACVVYATDGPATQTVYYAGNGGYAGEGNSGGYIGSNDGNSGTGEIGGAAFLKPWTIGSMLGGIGMSCIIFAYI